MPPSGNAPTERIDDPTRGPLATTRAQRVAVLSWTDAAGPHEVRIDRPATVGSAPSADVVVDDPSVSRVHVEFDPGADGLRIRDLGSTNGTVLHGVAVRDGLAREDLRLRLGRIEMHVRHGTDTIATALWPRPAFGGLLGRSTVMRALFEQLAHVAPSPQTVILHGETGTGKEVVARTIHDRSPRASRAFVVVDCGALHPALIASELFGHARGSFSGAHQAREGAFEAADGGTLFLDEIGELPLDLQPKLLRALESRQIRRVGETAYRPIDVRVISASFRDLRELVNRRAFREDLYFRLAVVGLRVPSLRERADDIPMLIDHFLESHANAPPPPRAVLDELMSRAWIGNVRELRNMVDRASVLGWDRAIATDGTFLPVQRAPASDAEDASVTDAAVADAAVADAAVADAPAAVSLSNGAQSAAAPFAAERPSLDGTYRDARDRWHAAFEREFLGRLMEKYRGDIVAAAADAQVHHSYLRKMLHEHGITWDRAR